MILKQGSLLHRLWGQNRYGTSYLRYGTNQNRYGTSCLRLWDQPKSLWDLVSAAMGPTKIAMGPRNYLAMGPTKSLWDQLNRYGTNQNRYGTSQNRIQTFDSRTTNVQKNTSKLEFFSRGLRPRTLANALPVALPAAGRRALRANAFGVVQFCSNLTIS